MYEPRRAVTYEGIEYAPGRKYRVRVTGAWLDGMITAGPSAWQGWRQDLQPGDILTCTGYGPGFGSDPGFGVEFTSEQSEIDEAFHCEVRPMAGGIWNYHPAPGVVEPVPEEAVA